jgi:hypothetical protein
MQMGGRGAIGAVVSHHRAFVGVFSTHPEVDSVNADGALSVGF